MRWAVALVFVLAVACSQAPGPERSIAEACEPSRAVVDPLIGVEVEAAGAGEVEGWALIFAAHTRTEPGDDLVFDVDEELKVVWRLTGEGHVSFRAIGPDGVVEPLTWGPKGPRGSNWDRPGGEWGTGWVLPSVGCWTLEAVRGEAVLSISMEVI